MAELTEEQLFEVFELTPPSETPEAAIAGTSPEAAMKTSARIATEALKPDNGDTGTAKSSAPMTDGGADEPSETETDKDPEGQETQKGLSEEQRRRNAARRRRKEQRLALDEALEGERERAVNEALAKERVRYKEEWDAFFAKAKLKNTITGQPIRSKEEFEQWSSAFDSAKLERDLKAGKLTRDGLNAAISQHPAIKALAEREQREAGEKEKQGQDDKRSIDEAAKARMEAQLRESHELDPSISTMEDLVKMPKAKEFYEKVSRGATFTEAFYLINREELTARQVEAARQQALSAARSKNHLGAGAKAVGIGAEEVPADVMEHYRLLNPNATDAEIRKHWNSRQR